MEKITDKQEVGSMNINGNDYSVPKDMSLSTLGFFVMNASSNVSKEVDKFSTQVQVDALFNPEETT